MVALATTPTDQVEEDPLLLYEPIAKQISAKKIPWTITYELVTPEQAQEWLDQADEHTAFGQRRRTPARVRRWLDLYRTNRYAFYNPMAALCFSDIGGILMNGGNRLSALAQFDDAVGFQIVRNCPVWMINYFDNGNNRTLTDSMYINQRKLSAPEKAAVRLGMRYEEFLFGKRKELGWAEWARHKDEHVDVDNFVEKREYLLDFGTRGSKMAKSTNLQAASLICFIAYQQLAWPDGSDKLEEFLDGLQFGSNLSKGNPALTLREWARTDGYIGGYTYGRREGQLLLLFKYFAMFVEGHSSAKVQVARGFPMSMPYHPQGWDVACKNARESLVEMG